MQIISNVVLIEWPKSTIFISYLKMSYKVKVFVFCFCMHIIHAKIKNSAFAYFFFIQVVSLHIRIAHMLLIPGS